jgi:hypothetical protein
MRLNPGDILLDRFTISSSRIGTWNAKGNFLTAKIVETIFSPGIEADFEVIDFDESFKNYQVQSDEEVVFQYTTARGRTGSYTLQLHSKNDGKYLPNLRATTYVLNCTSKETMTGQGTYTQNGYNTNLSNIVSSVFGELGSIFNIEVEPTKGLRKFVVSHQPIFHAIETLRKEAISAENPSSNFMFFQAASGYKFKTLEGMYNSGTVKHFKLTNTTNKNFFDDGDTNILAHTLTQVGNAMSRVLNGSVNQEVASFNMNSNEFVTKEFKGLATGLTKVMDAAFPGIKQTIMQITNANKDLQIGKSFLPDSMGNKMSSLSEMQEMMLNLTVIGDPVLEAGRTIETDFPSASGTGSQQLDPISSGVWLMTKVQHTIGDIIHDKPRHTCSIECMRPGVT